MKKFYFLLVAMLVGFAANAATVYFENTANWAKVYAYCFNPETVAWPGAEVTTKVTISGKELYKVETASANIIFNPGGDNGKTKDLPATDGIVYNANNANSLDAAGSVVNGEFVAAGDVEITYAQIYIPVSEWDKAACYIYSWSPYLFGGWPGAQMTKTTVDDTAYWTIKIDDRELSGETINWKLNAGQGQAESDNVEGADMFKDGYVYTLKGTSYELGQGGGDDPIIEENYNGWYLNVQGDYNGYNPQGAQFKADGTAEKENQAIGTGEFELKIWDGKADSLFGTGGVIQPNTEVTVYKDGGHMTIAGATEGKAYDVYFNYVTKTLKVVPVGGDDPIVVTTEVPEALYIIGDVCAWNTNAGIELTKNGDVFTGEAIEFPATGENTVSYFNLSDKLGANWDAVNPIANRYGAETEGDELVSGVASEVVIYKNNVNASACKSWTIEPGKYDVKVDFSDIENVTITLTSASSGVDAIAIDSNNAAPVYYNLQGVQVNEPAAGLYIVRRGDKVAKEIVR